MQLDELLHQRQTDPRALVATALRALDAMEPVEDARQFVSRNAGAGIPHRQQHAGIARAVSDTETPPVERELERVGDEVQDDLFPHLAIDDRPVRRVASDVDAIGERRRESIADRNVLARSRGESDEIDRLEADLTRPASMREKSSSVLTSFKRRRLLRCATSS